MVTDLQPLLVLVVQVRHLLSLVVALHMPVVAVGQYLERLQIIRVVLAALVVAVLGALTLVLGVVLKSKQLVEQLTQVEAGEVAASKAAHRPDEMAQQAAPVSSS